MYTIHVQHHPYKYIEVQNLPSHQHCLWKSWTLESSLQNCNIIWFTSSNIVELDTESYPQIRDVLELKTLHIYQVVVVHLMSKVNDRYKLVKSLPLVKWNDWWEKGRAGNVIVKGIMQIVERYTIFGVDIGIRPRTMHICPNLLSTPCLVINTCG